MEKTKTKRIKRAFGSASAVAELWAKQSQDSAHCKNAFFKGRDLYSYGYHYLLGRILEINGVKIAAIQSTGYSKTTYGQSWDARSAARKAGLPYYNFEGRGGVSVKSGVTDEELKDLIREGLERERDKIYDGLGQGMFSRWTWCGRNEALEHNKECRRIGVLSALVEVPESYWRKVREVSKGLEAAAKDYSRRVQIAVLLPHADEWGYNNEIRRQLRCSAKYTA